MMPARSAIRSIVAIIAFAAAAAVSQPASAQTRYVIVNGNLLQPEQVARIEALFCTSIANGRYWYDPETSIWGYEGNPLPQGQFVNRCRGANGYGSLSQRGLLYSMSEILSGR